MDFRELGFVGYFDLTFIRNSFFLGGGGGSGPVWEESWDLWGNASPSWMKPWWGVNYYCQ